MAGPTDKLINRIDGSQIRASFENYRGTKRIDIRTYYRDPLKGFVPSPKGLSLTFAEAAAVQSRMLSMLEGAGVVQDRRGHPGRPLPRPVPVAEPLRDGRNAPLGGGKHMINCPACAAKLNVPLEAAVRICGCPTCKANFEASFSGGVLLIAHSKQMMKQQALPGLRTATAPTRGKTIAVRLSLLLIGIFLGFALSH